MKIAHFFGSLGEILFSAKLKQVIHKKVPKTYLELIFEHFLSTAFRDLMKNNFDWKFPKNEQISLNKVQKMTNKIIFSIKSKMLTVYGFHMDFQFWAQKWLPRDL